jgi:hypothetical protein
MPAFLSFLSLSFFSTPTSALDDLFIRNVLWVHLAVVTSATARQREELLLRHSA